MNKNKVASANLKLINPFNDRNTVFKHTMYLLHSVFSFKLLNSVFHDKPVRIFVVNKTSDINYIYYMCPIERTWSVFKYR